MDIIGHRPDRHAMRGTVSGFMNIDPNYSMRPFPCTDLTRRPNISTSETVDKPRMPRTSCECLPARHVRNNILPDCHTPTFIIFEGYSTSLVSVACSQINCVRGVHSKQMIIQYGDESQITNSRLNIVFTSGVSQATKLLGSRGNLWEQ